MDVEKVFKVPDMSHAFDSFPLEDLESMVNRYENFEMVVCMSQPVDDVNSVIEKEKEVSKKKIEELDRRKGELVNLVRDLNKKKKEVDEKRVEVEELCKNVQERMSRLKKDNMEDAMKRKIEEMEKKKEEDKMNEDEGGFENWVDEEMKRYVELEELKLYLKWLKEAGWSEDDGRRG